MNRRQVLVRPGAVARLALALAFSSVLGRGGLATAAEDAAPPDAPISAATLAQSPPTAEAPPAASPASTTAPRAYDPWEGYNRWMFGVNLKIDRAVLRPLARGYRSGVPAPVRTGLANFLDNLEKPLDLVNDLLQGKPLRAAGDLARFVVNLTAGVGGFLDPATGMDLPQSDEDFGQTLGRWGWDPGPYLVLPLLPPGGLRDQLGFVPDQALDPFSYADSEWVGYGGKALDAVEGRSRLLDFDEALDQAYDPYAFVRDAVTQRRAYAVRDGAVEPMDYDDLYEDPLDEPGDVPADEPPAATPPAEASLDEPPPR